MEIGVIYISRLARKDLNTPFLHVMVQGVNKKYIFNKDSYIKKYMNLLKKYNSEYDVNILAYCIMNNHAHFLIYVENISELGKFMHKVNCEYAKEYNKNENRCGVLFRNRYQAEPIYDIKYLINCIIYIHQNPVKANIVSKCEHYHYSSYNDYLTNTGVSNNKILNEIFGKNCNYLKLFKEIQYKMFIDIDEDDYENVKGYIIKGIEEFKKQHSKKLFEVFAERDILKKLIRFLNNDCGIKYVYIRDFFEIPRGVMDKLK